MSQIELAKIFLSKRTYKASGNIIDDGERLRCLDEVIPLYFVTEVFNMLEEGTFKNFMENIAREVPAFMQANPDLKEMVRELGAEVRKKDIE